MSRHMPALLPLLLLAVTDLSSCVPARWPSPDPQSLALLKGTPINCLVVPKTEWPQEFLLAARESGIRVLASVSGSPEAAPEGFAGFLVETELPREAVEKLSRAARVVEASGRARLLQASPGSVAGTHEALWPGVRLETPEGKTQAAPSGAPWIDTNSGFVRFARALTGAHVWLTNRPPAGRVFTADQYVAAAADAAVAGARWVLALDDDLQKRLLAREPRALQDWATIARGLAFLEEHRAWMLYPPSGQLAVIQDADSGAALSAGLMDMIGSRHTPARIVPSSRLSPESLRGVSLAINIEPDSVPDGSKQVLREFTRGGGRVFNSPPGWHFPRTEGYVLALEKLSKEEVGHFDLIWRQITSQTWNKNMGARLYNVASMVSHLAASPDQSRSYLFLVNYSGYEAENITVHVPGKFSKAILHTPEAAAQGQEIYELEEGTGIDIARLKVAGILELTARP